jgi:integrase
MHLDGAGLYLQVTGRGRSWIYRFKSPVSGKTREMGLGPTHTYGLARARELASEARGLVKAGYDPIDRRDEDREVTRLEALRDVIFETAAEKYIEAHRNSWRTPKHETQMRSMLKNYAFPDIGQLPVSSIEDEQVRQILEPIWHIKLETARRVRGHIEAVLARETHLKHRKGDNPARLESIKTALGPQASTVRHMPALPYAEIGKFMVDLKAKDGIAAKMLAFTILTAARTNEVIGARWDEFNFSDEVWVIPAARMKANRGHRVPLSPAALVIVKAASEYSNSDFVFPSTRAGKHLSNMAMLTLLKRMGRNDVTVHGFRSSFRDWAAEQTSYAREIAESALAHVISDATERAYLRSDLFDKRRRLMNDWAKYCNTVAKKGGKTVVAIRG